jgi:hypothetical protein
MAEKRRAKRYLKRLKLRYGPENAVRLAFTEEISFTGLFIKTHYVMKPGSIITIELYYSEDMKISIEGRVMWAKRVPAPLLNQVKKAGMGVKIIRILSGKEMYQKLCSVQRKI